MNCSSVKEKRGHFLHIFVLYQCIVYRIHFQNIHAFAYQKTLLHTLVFEIVESLQCIIHKNTSLLAGLVSPFTI